MGFWEATTSLNTTKDSVVSAFQTSASVVWRSQKWPILAPALSCTITIPSRDFYQSPSCLIWSSLCTGYTSGSDLQGEAMIDSREDSRDSRAGVPVVEQFDDTAAACVRSVTNLPETLSSKYYFWLRQVSCWLVWSVVTCLIAVHEIAGLNSTLASCAFIVKTAVIHITVLHTLTSVFRSTQPSALHGMVIVRF